MERNVRSNIIGAMLAGGAIAVLVSRKRSKSRTEIAGGLFFLGVACRAFAVIFVLNR